MQLKNHFTGLQVTALITLRFLTGWHILYEGVAKLLDPQWTSFSFLDQSQGILSGFASWVTSRPDILNIVDFLNIWGLIAIGLGLLLGLFARTAAIAGALLIFVYYLNAPPLIGVEYALPVNGNYLIVDKTLIEAASLCVLALFPTSRVFGLDALLWHRKSK
jgi:thiosulfate dehydrogenase (quinone) large subunit